MEKFSVKNKCTPGVFVVFCQAFLRLITPDFRRISEVGLPFFSRFFVAFFAEIFAVSAKMSYDTRANPSATGKRWTTATKWTSSLAMQQWQLR